MISNPCSGGNKKGFGRIRDFAAANPDIHHREAVCPEEMGKALAEFAAREIDLLIVNGGDGTVQAILTAIYGRDLFTRPPVMALLQAGTTSMLARDVGIIGTPLQALGKIREWRKKGADVRQIQQRPVLKVQQAATKWPLCGMFFGAGAIPIGIQLCHNQINPNGVRGEFFPGLILARLLLSVLAGQDKHLPVLDLESRLDNGPVQRSRYLFALVSTLERLFLGLRPYWGEEQAPLHFTAVRSKPPYLLRNLPAILRGRTNATISEANGYFSHNAHRVQFDFTGMFTLDGELFEATSPLAIETAGPAGFLKL